MSESPAAMQQFVLALAAAAMTIGACSLGLRESQVGEPPASGGSTQSASSTPGNGGGATTSTATSGVLCGNGSCDRPAEDCSSCPGDCGCFTGTGCKAGKCEDCPETFAVDVGASDAGATHGLVAANGKLYLAPTLSSGGSTNAALAEIDACFGTVLSTTVHAPGGRLSTGGPIALGGTGAEVVAACGYWPSDSDHGGGLVFGGNEGPVAAWQLDAPGSSGNDALHGVAAAKNVWMATGVLATASPGWVVFGDLNGQKICPVMNVFPSSVSGAAATTDGTKIYVAGNSPTTSSFSIAVFDASTCDASSCGCAAPQNFDGIMIGTDTTVVAAMLFAANELYVAGYKSNDGVAYQAFVASISPTDGSVVNVYPHPGSAALDEFVSLAFDGTLIYAGGYEDAPDDQHVETATGVVVGLTPALGMSFTVRPSGAHSVVGVATDPSQPGAFFAHVDKSPGVAVYRCKSSSAHCGP